MPLIPDPPFHKTQGDNIRSKDWNDLADEVIRLGSVPLGIGTSTPDETVTVEAAKPAVKLTRPQGEEVVVGVQESGTAFVGSVTTDLALFTDGVTVTLKKDGFVGINVPNPTAQLDVAGEIRAGEIRARDDIVMPTSAGRLARLSDGVFATDGANPSHLRLIMQGNNNDAYEFSVGHLAPIDDTTMFVTGFRVDHRGNFVARGNISAGGTKTGYVADFFVNAIGDDLEEGDVVVLNGTAPVEYYGVRDTIPVPEVDLTDQAYDSRVCGIVCGSVRAAELPVADRIPEGKDLAVNPLARFAAPDDPERIAVADQHLGRMVTLGAYAHCKVDADIAPIVPGDLLTTSPTRGHAQKVVDRGQAMGAVLGKAMGPLASGRGTVPILVTLQ